jgi:hypothetical protein
MNNSDIHLDRNQESEYQIMFREISAMRNALDNAASTKLVKMDSWKNKLDDQVAFVYVCAHAEFVSACYAYLNA